MITVFAIFLTRVKTFPLTKYIIEARLIFGEVNYSVPFQYHRLQQPLKGLSPRKKKKYIYFL